MFRLVLTFALLCLPVVVWAAKDEDVEPLPSLEEISSCPELLGYHDRRVPVSFAKFRGSKEEIKSRLNEVDKRFFQRHPTFKSAKSISERQELEAKSRGQNGAIKQTLSSAPLLPPPMVVHFSITSVFFRALESTPAAAQLKLLRDSIGEIAGLSFDEMVRIVSAFKSPEDQVAAYLMLKPRTHDANETQLLGYKPDVLVDDVRPLALQPQLHIESDLGQLIFASHVAYLPELAANPSEALTRAEIEKAIVDAPSYAQAPSAQAVRALLSKLTSKEARATLLKKLTLPADGPLPSVLASKLIAQFEAQNPAFERMPFLVDYVRANFERISMSYLQELLVMLPTTSEQDRLFCVYVFVHLLPENQAMLVEKLRADRGESNVRFLRRPKLEGANVLGLLEQMQTIWGRNRLVDTAIEAGVVDKEWTRRPEVAALLSGKDIGGIGKELRANWQGLRVWEIESYGGDFSKAYQKGLSREARLAELDFENLRELAKAIPNADVRDQVLKLSIERSRANFTIEQYLQLEKLLRAVSNEELLGLQVGYLSAVLTRKGLEPFHQALDKLTRGNKQDQNSYIDYMIEMGLPKQYEMLLRQADAE